MKYKEFVQQQKQKFPSLGQIYDILFEEKNKKSNKKRIVTFSHDDPDGVTAAIIFKRLTDKLGLENEIILPQKYELTIEEIKNVVQKYNPDILFIIDKGTLEKYNSYTSIIRHIIVIDHHPPIGKDFTNLIVYNPSLERHTPCSTSLLVHILSSLFNIPNTYDDFLALIGLRCDWAVDVLNNYIPEFCQPFVEEKIVKKYKWLLTPIKNKKITMFDVSQQHKSCLLNYLAELFFALTGGGFQYFYNDYDSELKNINQPEFCFTTFLKDIKLKKIVSVIQFIKLLDKKTRNIVKKIYNYFNLDWNETEQLFDKNTIFTGEFDGVKIYLFVGNKVRLMPMVGSLKLYEYAENKEAILVMINLEPTGSVHISFRSNTDKIHLGNLASKLAQQLVTKFGYGDEITGGGHPRAAELKTRQSNLPFLVVISNFFEVFKEVIKI